MPCICRSLTIRALSAGVTMLGLSKPLVADVAITSEDGRWTAIIEDTGGGAGQCLSLKDNNAVAAYQEVIAGTTHFVRLAGALVFNGVNTVRMSNSFSLVSFMNSEHTFAAVLRSNNFAGVIAIVHGEMSNGSSGGLRMSLEFADLDPSPVPLATLNLKPFVYANMNVDGQADNNVGSWNVDRFEQAANNTGTGNVRWFRGRNPVAHQSDYGHTLLSVLDAGIIDLTNATGSGPGDLTTAMSFATGSLAAGYTHRAAYALGGQNSVIYDAFGVPTTDTQIGLRSDDWRWGAILWTGQGVADFGSAGEIVNMRNFDEPAAQDQFVSRGRNYVAISPTTTLTGVKVRDTFRRVSLLHSINNMQMFTTVLNSKQWPGLMLIISGQIVSGDQGGLLMCLKYVDTLSRGLNIAPISFVDMDCDEQTTDVGGFSGDHFWQHSGGVDSQVRWFLPATFANYASGETVAFQDMLNAGAITLSNSTIPGPANIGTAVAFHPWPLSGTAPYIVGYALGNPGIAIPEEFFVPSASLVCAADIVPAPNGDGMVNVQELLEVINHWGPCPTGCPADIVPSFVGDGAVNVQDLLEVINHWGACVPN